MLSGGLNHKKKLANCGSDFLTISYIFKTIFPRNEGAVGITGSNSSAPRPFHHALCAFVSALLFASVFS